MPFLYSKYITLLCLILFSSSSVLLCKFAEFPPPLRCSSSTEPVRGSLCSSSTFIRSPSFSHLPSFWHLLSFLLFYTVCSQSKCQENVQRKLMGRSTYISLRATVCVRLCADTHLSLRLCQTKRKSNSLHADKASTHGPRQIPTMFWSLLHGNRKYLLVQHFVKIIKSAIFTLWVFLRASQIIFTVNTA